MRHSWKKTTVEVPWSSAPGNLYTCRHCKITRQSIPDADGIGRYVHEYGQLLPSGERHYFRSGNVPSCDGTAESFRRSLR